MEQQRQHRGLLNVVSILYLIGAVIVLIGFVLMLAGTFAFQGTAAAPLSGLFAFLAVVIGAEGVFLLLAGIFGLRRNGRTAATVISIIILVLAILSLVLNLMTSGFSWWSIVGIILPVLYFVGVALAYR